MSVLTSEAIDIIEATLAVRRVIRLTLSCKISPGSLRALGLTGIDKSKVSRNCKELDEVVNPFRTRPLKGQCPFVWLDVLYLKVRHNHRIVSQGLVIATGVRESGDREVLGFALGSQRGRGIPWIVRPGQAGWSSS